MLTARDMLQMATVNGATVAGLGGKVGSLPRARRRTSS
jgi:imidazolonepropionase-like amidohydrolase